MSCCKYCRDEEKPLQNYYGTILSQACIEMEITTDWDEYERKKRKRIEEQY
jgi:hypothetical protein